MEGVGIMGGDSVVERLHGVRVLRCDVGVFEGKMKLEHDCMASNHRSQRWVLDNGNCHWCLEDA